MQIETGSLIPAAKLGAKAMCIAVVFCLSLLKSAEGVSLQSSCLVTVSGGGVQGADLGASCAFLGIPYAASTAGTNRWKAPQPAAPWASVLNATVPPTQCPLTNQAGALTGNEDCLKLNIWVGHALPRVPAPVIVWIHTG